MIPTHKRLSAQAVMKHLDQYEQEYLEKVEALLTAQVQFEMDRLYKKHPRVNKATVAMGVYFVTMDRPGYNHAYRRMEDHDTVDYHDAPKYMASLMELLNRANSLNIWLDIWPTDLPEDRRK